MNKHNHLYVHIPFCKSICTYCNFKKEILNSNKADAYINKICLEINNIKSKLKTIYIGGGTPNSISDELLEKLLSELSSKKDVNCEFTIEINPESLTDKQIDLYKRYGVNRFSIGIQILNDKILKILNRKHNTNKAIEAVDKLMDSGFDNISCDFIYNLPLMKFNDIDNIINFINNKNIKHLSFYSLEVKEGSILDKQGYKVNEDKEEDFMEYLEKSLLTKTKMKRYEVSNWAISQRYYSQHNLCYWNMSDWIGIGYGSTGYENRTSYENVGSISNWYRKSTYENDEEYYKTILIMGLRKIKGIDLSIKKNMEAFNYYKNKLNKDLYIIDKNHLKCININLLNSLLVGLYE